MNLLRKIVRAWSEEIYSELDPYRASGVMSADQLSQVLLEGF